MSATPPLKSTCHCGAITLTLPYTPKIINECQCTICRRYAAAWAYYKVDEVTFSLVDGAKLSQCYHWPIEEKNLKNPDGTTAEFGVNTRNMDPMDVLNVDRKIDKAWLFQPIENKERAHEQDRARY
ncbi:MAG: hypothetical protein Q9160_008967 [Pyrenula sp. 1 TL-2023]